MLKIIGFIFILLSGISLIVIASLFTGINIDHISYKNINIKKLYLKYDKKLNISTSNISFHNQNSQEYLSLKSSFSVNYNNGLFKVDLQELKIKDTDLDIKGLIYIDRKQIDFNAKSSLMIEDLFLTFDKKMKNVTSKNGFIEYENGLIDLSLQTPYYGDIDMSGSKVSYSIDKNTLMLYLKTKSLFNDTLRSALARYNVEIDTIQYDGKNDISVNIFIPFNENDVVVESDVTILNSNLEDYGQKYKVDKSVLHYKDKILKGKVNLNHYNYEDINVTNSIVDYTINFNDGFQVKIDADTINLEKNDKQYYLNNSILKIDNDKLSFVSKATDESNKLEIDFNNTTNLTTKKFNGIVNLDYNDANKSIKIQSDDISYNGNFKENLELSVKSEHINIVSEEQNQIKNLSMNLKNSNIETKFHLLDNLHKIKVKVSNKTDLEKKISYGSIDIDKFMYKNLVNINKKHIPYNLSFKDSFIVNAPLFGLTYYKPVDSSIHKLLISNPNKLLNAFTFIKTNNSSDGFIDIESDNFMDTTILVDNINVDINSTYFSTKEDTQNEAIILPQFPKINLRYTSSSIKYNNFTLPFDTLNLYTNNNTLNINMAKEKSIILLKTQDNALFFNAYNLSDTFVNTFLNKDILEDGYLNLNIYGDDINFLSGDINFHKTTVKNVTIVNSLLTFVNTTPAIINPLLALPTLFRLAETGFDTNGYYMKEGNGSFQYNLPTQQLDIYDLYTDGKMSNFIVNSHFNLKTKEVDSTVDISFLKDFTKAIRYIPIVGYIIMGDDGEFHTSVNITGTTDNPILNTNTLKNATNGVSGIVERILTLPIQPFNVETTKEQRIEHEKRVEDIFK